MKTKIVANDVTFATLIREAQMHVRFSQGIVLLQDDETSKPYFLPSGFVLPPAAANEPCTAFIRQITDEVILERGANDVTEAELGLKRNVDVMPVDEWDDILTLMDELKLKKVTGVLVQLVNAIGGLLLLVASIWLLTTDFFLKPALYVTLVVGAVVLCWSGYKAVMDVLHLNSKVIMDKRGSYINLDTGKSNLNGGMKIPIKSQ